jgi:hypothetical protein
LVSIVFLTVFTLGCGGDSKHAPAQDERADGLAGERGQARLLKQAAQQPAPDKEKAAQAEPTRKIIYTAAINLIVEDYAKGEKELLALVKAEKGYVAHSDVINSPGQPRVGHWKVRIPVAGFDAFKEALRQLGELQSLTQDSEDVTDAYYDTRARVKNKEVEEEGLRKLLTSATKIEDHLAVRRELSNLRQEIDQHQGQIQRWDKLTAMTTVDITLRDRRDYVPPESASFADTIGRTFEKSLKLLVDFGKLLILVVISLAPWLLVAALIGVPLWRVTRRWRSRQAPAPATPRATVTEFVDDAPENPKPPQSPPS